jgi:hypothetical protein
VREPAAISGAGLELGARATKGVRLASITERGLGQSRRIIHGKVAEERLTRERKE